MNRSLLIILVVSQMYSTITAMQSGERQSDQQTTVTDQSDLPRETTQEQAPLKQRTWRRFDLSVTPPNREQIGPKK